MDDCIDLPCANGGTCMDLVDDYSCSCVAGLEGKNCTTGKEKIILLGLYVYFYIFIFIVSYYIHKYKKRRTISRNITLRKIPYQ